MEVIGEFLEPAALSQISLAVQKRDNIRKELARGIQPPDLYHKIVNQPIFSPGLFNEETMKEADDQAAVCYDKTFQKAYAARKRPAPEQLDNTVRKKSRPSLPMGQFFRPATNQRQETTRSNTANRNKNFWGQGSSRTESNTVGHSKYSWKPSKPFSGPQGGKQYDQQRITKKQSGSKPYNSQTQRPKTNNQ